MQFTAPHYKQNKNKSAEICALCNMVGLFTGCAPWCAYSASYGRRVCSLCAHHIVLHTKRLKQSGQRLVGGGVDWTRLEANYIQPDTGLSHQHQSVDIGQDPSLNITTSCNFSEMMMVIIIFLKISTMIVKSLMLTINTYL